MSRYTCFCQNSQDVLLDSDGCTVVSSEMSLQDMRNCSFFNDVPFLQCCQHEVDNQVEFVQTFTLSSLSYAVFQFAKEVK